MSLHGNGTRKFAKGLSRPGTASKRRESASQVIRDSFVSGSLTLDLQVKPPTAEPIDYEAFVLKRQTEIHHDPQRNLLDFPYDDVVATTKHREGRTVVDTVPDEAEKEATTLIVKESIKTCRQGWQLLVNKYEDYAGNYNQLPRNESKPKLDEMVFEIDEVAGKEDDNSSVGPEGVSKMGWLYKAPSYTGNISIRSFKRRFFHLKQQADGFYVLHFYKDEKISREPKGSIFLDSCIGSHTVSLSTKARKYAFEVQMQDNSSHLLASDSENDTANWIAVINQALQNTIEAQLQENNERAQRLDAEKDNENSNAESLSSSMHPQLSKYAKETDQKNAIARKSGRKDLFHIFPEFQSSMAMQDTNASFLPPPSIKSANTRVFVQCKLISFILRGVVIEGAEEPITNIEPFFVTLSLYDIAEGKKISADVHVDLNHPLVRKMIPSHLSSPTKQNPQRHRQDNEPSLKIIKPEFIAYPKQCLFNVSRPHPDIFLVVRIEKVLQGGIKSCAQPYLRHDGDNNKAALKALKHAKAACHRLGQYRMPFAWTAKPLFCDNQGTIDNSGFDIFYKQEAAKLAEEDLLKYLGDFRRPEKLTKLEDIDCTLKVDFKTAPSVISNLVTSSYVPVKPYTAATEPVMEVDMFVSNAVAEQQPHMEYINHFYVYPKSLKYDSQKTFAKARNLACVVEFRDSDAEGTKPLAVFYQRPGTEIFSTQMSTTVLHHNAYPEFYDEMKLELPTQLHHGHHLLFSFYHVIVDPAGKKKDALQSEVGYAWLPLLREEGRVWDGERTLQVSANLPPGYLSSDEISALGRGHPEIKLVDSGKPLFKVASKMVSSLYTTDIHLHNFFESCQRFYFGVATSDQDVVKYLKTLLAVEEAQLIPFLPTVLNQLFRLLASKKSSKDIQLNCVKSIVHIVKVCHSCHKEDSLAQYIKYIFVTEQWHDTNTPTVHEELVTTMNELLRPSVTDFLTLHKILRYLSFFLNVAVKSMGQHLISTKRWKLKRNERFPVRYQQAIQNLLTTIVPHIVAKWKTNYDDVRFANSSLANFVKNCFTYIDRGLVFKLINNYMENFAQSDHRVLFEFKFEFLRIVCSHEHYIPLNLPFTNNTRRTKTEFSFMLTDEYCKTHFLTGLLLQNVNAAMHEVADIRDLAIKTLKNLLAKHAFDNRYHTTPHQERISTLYLPFLRTVLDNAARFDVNEAMLTRDESHSSRDDLDATPASLSGVFKESSGDRSGSLRMKNSDVNSLAAISTPSSALITRGSRGSMLNSQDVQNMSLSSVQEKMSVASKTQFSSGDCFDDDESKSLLICFLSIVKNIPSDALKGFWQQSSTDELIDFFDIVEVGMYRFRYTGKKKQVQNIRFVSMPKSSNKSLTMPGRIRPGTAHQYRHISALAEPVIAQANAVVTETELQEQIMLEANLASEVSMTVLDLLGEFTRHFKKNLLNKDGDNRLMERVSSIFLLFLKISQSEYVLHHAFASLRWFMFKFPAALFRGKADLCASLVYQALRCCNSYLPSTRSEACALLYLLMRTNFEYSKRNFVRSHLQMVKAVSQLITEENNIGSARFQMSLSVINNFASSDKGMQKNMFPIEVKDLTKRMRTVLMATAAMKEHKDDPEKLVDLQYSLAKSYAGTPELRKTWLENMAKAHEKNGNFSEAAMCYIHITALVAEYLKRKGIITKGCSGFRTISPNVEKEESALKEDTGMQDAQYSEDMLIDLLRRCVASLKSAERYELMATVYRMIIPFYEKRHDFEGLVEIYGTLQEAYEKIVEVNRTGRRMLGTYFRIGFYGQQFDEEDGREYIYKEPKLTQLSEISMRLQNLYTSKFGAENFKMIQESSKVNRKELDPKMCYVQVTFVNPYFDENEQEQRKTKFERSHNIRNFVFETPFTPHGKARGDIEEQWKRKTILTTAHSFPYVKKRIIVTSQRCLELKPIEVALDEMTNKCNELEDLVFAKPIDLKKLQLRLQGSVSVQVNAGPLAYAKSFLNDKKIANHATNTIDQLKRIFRRFVDLCGKALEINGQLVPKDQFAYHDSLNSSFQIMTTELSQILHEQFISDDEDTISITASSMGGEMEGVFSQISGSSRDNTPKRYLQGTVSDASNV